MSSRWFGICVLSASTSPVVSARQRCYGPDSTSVLLPGRVRRAGGGCGAGRAAGGRGPARSGRGLAGAAGDLMGANNIGVARVGWQRRLRPSGGSRRACRRGFASSVASFRGCPSGFAWVQPAYRDQAHAQVAYLDQDPVQRWLVCHRPGDDRFPGLAADLEALKPTGPALAEDPLNADLVMGRRPRAAHAGPPAGGLESSHSLVLSRVYVLSLHATKRPRARRHPKVPSGWNLQRRHRAQRCRSPGPTRAGQRRPAR